MKIDWEKIDWDKVGKEKAAFLFREAKDNEHEVVSAINDLNRKAFNLLALTLPLLIALGSALLSLWNVLESALKWSGAAMVSGLMMGSAFLLAAIYPQCIAYVSGSPDTYFSSEFYKSSMLDILHGNLISAAKRVDRNERILARRGRFFILAAAVLLVIVPGSAVIFIAVSW